VLFTSLHFIVFFALVLALNQMLRRWPLLQKLMLLLASYYFYAQWNWHYLFLVWFSTLVDYTIGLRLPPSGRIPAGLCTRQLSDATISPRP